MTGNVTKVKETDLSRIGVIGAGSWGTTLANHLAGKGLEVDLWAREPEVLRQIEEHRENRTFLPGVELYPSLRGVGSFEEALVEKRLVLMVVPSHVFREVLIGMKPYLRSGVTFMTGTKGIENESLMMMSEVAESVLGQSLTQGFACLSGPSFAREVSGRYPTAVTIACRDMEYAGVLQRLFYSEYFRVYTTQDLVGVQLGGALKNVVAIAAGASDALGFGHNARAALITRGLAEIARVGVSMGANPHTFAGLAGMGDLVLTCTGDLSRNRTVGFKIGTGMSLEKITESMSMVAEGIKTARSAHELGLKMGVDMPITRQVFEILYEKKDPREAVKELMTRALKAELEH